MTVARLAAHLHDIAELAMQTAERTPRHTARRARRAAHHALTLAARLPAAAATLNAAASELDGWGSTTGSYDRGPRGSGIGRPVEALALRRQHTAHGDATELAQRIIEARAFAAVTVRLGDDQTDDLDDQIRLVDTALGLAHRLVDRHTPRAETPRCAGDGSSLGATCTQVPDFRVGDGGIILPSRSGQCIDCQMATERRTKADRERSRQRRLHSEREAR